MRRLTIALAVLVVLAGLSFQPDSSNWVRPRTIAAQNDCQTFPETGKSVCGIFLSYWRANGGLAQQGFPISDVFREESSNGQTYDTQYFERAVFERHPENAGTRFEVLLALVGSERLKAKYPAGPPAGQAPAPPPAPAPAPPPPAPAPPLPAGLSVLSSSDYVAGSGSRYIVGEVLNNTGQNHEFVKIVASLYDAGGTLVRAESGYADLDIVEAQQRAGFSILISNPPANVQRYVLQVQGRATSNAPLSGLQIVPGGERPASSQDRRYVFGEIRNNSGGPVEFVKIVVTMFDGGGRVVGVDTGYTDLDDLAAGQTSPFEVLVDRWVNVARYELAVQGRRP